MSRIHMIWVRHGATFGNTKRRYIGVTDEPILSEEKDRLEKVRESLKEKCPFPADAIDGLYASPLIRCQETASILFPGQEIITIPELRECDFGKFENRNYLEMEGDADYQRWVDSGGTLPFPGGESMEILQARSCEGLRRIVRDCAGEKDKTIALAVHGGTIMGIFSVMADQDRAYYEWHVGNGEGYFTEIDVPAFLEGDEHIEVLGRF